MTDDVKFRSLAEGAKTMEFTRTSTCKYEVKHYFAGLTDDWEMVYYRIDEYIAQGDRVVALGQVSFKNKHTGKICEFFEFYDTAQAMDKATPRPAVEK